MSILAVTTKKFDLDLSLCDLSVRRNAIRVRIVFVIVLWVTAGPRRRSVKFRLSIADQNGVTALNLVLVLAAGPVSHDAVVHVAAVVIHFVVVVNVVVFIAVVVVVVVEVVLCATVIRVLIGELVSCWCLISVSSSETNNIAKLFQQ